MKFIVKFYPEITIKSKSVRRRYCKLLQSNVRNVLRRFDETSTVHLDWDKINVATQNESAENRSRIIDALQCIPGIAHILEVSKHEFTDVDSIYQTVAPIVAPSIEGKTFCVRVKRAGNHDFSSNEVERYVGGGLNQNYPSGGVKLKKPDHTVHLEIRNNDLFVIAHRFEGIGGFPLPAQEDVLSLMSGGFDSGVSSYMMIKKGARTHYCFFNLGGAAHEIGVKQVSYYLWDRFSASHKVKFITVPFEGVVGEILEKVENGQMGVILKRMMMRAAEHVAKKMKIEALVTGESLGQVSSQTLTNLSIIDKTVDTLILRPLAAYDKQDIINISAKIGTKQFAEVMPEYCGVISNKPTVKAVMSKIEAEEDKFDYAVLDKALEDSVVMDIRDIANETQETVAEVETVSDFADSDIVLDIRSPDEEDENPLEIDGVEVKHLPFYKLATQFGDLDQSKQYLFYCDRGVMSKLQALFLIEQGYSNIKVYRK
ncbi:tRNA uracil 4-sulfurtransferase ThiI [Psychrobium sp. 1_MG-2023]|uniref:tRNA uracil 4-sulfurtransferase ThiI n=1 Tax=Psychrobium sp. 1_MG-2023 TaxID=3062624 RepID=UPI000C3341E7|nr:tRNA uracil 4-sulfurtransferase ThiI [Psychrobium sp. 1_MG-2023]MDP2560046.1 tRNA uracil 4-sulfurtransferase ThiI [Psychrobium sp. 1_MG-2023]PKF56293.1 tRNA 4-thiouridine(8) synthase ThiI [Alteromonadales bacterium alter-6D02]